MAPQITNELIQRLDDIKDYILRLNITNEEKAHLLNSIGSTSLESFLSGHQSNLKGINKDIYGTIKEVVSKSFQLAVNTTVEYESYKRKILELTQIAKELNPNGAYKDF